jgi:DNA helicase-2/ATP-dependent DNA helicase PcrA
MLQFPEDYANASSISMSTNYRSGQVIVDMASRLIAMNRHRFPKDFISERGLNGTDGLAVYKKFKTHGAQMDFVLKTIKKRHGKGVPYSEMAVIFRTNRQAGLPVSELAKNELPFYTTEAVSSVYDGWMFRGIAAYIRLATGTGSRDDLLYVLNRPNRFLAESAFASCEYTAKSMLAAAGYLKKDAAWKYQAAEKNIRTWMRNFGPGTLTMTDHPDKVFEKLADPLGIDYDEYVLSYAKFRNFDEKETKEEFQALRKEASAFDTIEEWLRHARSESIHIREVSRKKDRTGIQITTMHKAKGLEWDTVFVIDVNEDIVPHKNTLESMAQVEEERRLLYVAMTRAKNALYILCSGKESPFMKQMKTALEKEEEQRRRAELNRKLEEEIAARKAAGELTDAPSDPVLGLVVMHRNFGKGYITSVDNDKGLITVRFVDKDRSFMYPQAFDRGFLSVIE